ncbi:receptor-interacting serine/threonine-protein kinase 3-like isoform X2 [Pseudophryne corroboree]|uniref:receptor-interacting serine/threonine-protein kinase 3-like isoform X2 n=1 Tax=Pseudophryne corroboree TaxID=495146 RepID=UPI0030813AAC
MLPLPTGDLDSLELVGSGGFGLVYRGWSHMLKMEIALKIIQGAHGTNLKRLMKDLMKERDVMQKASNPYVLRLLGWYQKPESDLLEYGLVMEYMPNGSLRSLFDNICDVPWALRFQILHQVVLGMNYLHSLDPPIIHRDLKPCNVLLNKHLDVQITDFGLSKIVGATTSTAAPCFAGTLSYMAPEALNDINYIPNKAYDVYSFGILTWTVFSGEEPYPGIHAAVIQRCVSEGQRPRASVLDQYNEVKMVPEAKELMIRCWNPNADDRPSFHDCSESTTEMFDAYQDSIVSAVRSLQDSLKKISSSDQLSDTSDYSSSYPEDLFREIAGGVTEEAKQPGTVNDGDQLELQEPGHTDSKVAQDTSTEATIKEEDVSGKEVMNKIVKVIKNSGDYRKVMDKFNTEGIITSTDQKQLDSSKTLKDLGHHTEKLILTKFIEKPHKIIPAIKSIFG